MAEHKSFGIGIGIYIHIYTKYIIRQERKLDATSMHVMMTQELVNYATDTFNRIWK
jgi:hypothetical protein